MRGAACIALVPICLALAGCSGPAIQCDDQGYIVIPPDTPRETATLWLGRNIDLNGRRSRRMLGELPWATPQSLAKAEGCP